MARSARLPLLCAAGCLVALALVAVAALGVGALQIRDEAVLHGFMALDRPGVHLAARALVHLADPLPYAAMGAACVIVALRRRLPARAVAVAVLLVVTGATTRCSSTRCPSRARWAGWRGRSARTPSPAVTRRQR